MKKQARLMQEKLDEMRDNLQNTLVEGSAGNGLVTVVLDGEKALKKIALRPECVTPDDVEGLQDLILAAFEDARRKVEAKQLPGDGGNMPFSPF